MQQRRPRLGDIVDDYCPRERRITNHAVVAMIEDEVKQTRCTTCDADHEYKQARVPAQRRKKDAAAGELAGGTPRKRAAAEPPDAPEMPTLTDSTPDATVDPDEPVEEMHTAPAPPPHAPAPEVSESPAAPAADPLDEASEEGPELEDDGPVHRRLIRATLPRPEGQAPERKLPDLTMHQREVNGNRAGRPQHRGPRPGQMRGQQGSGQVSRFGGQRQGAGPRQHVAPGHVPRHGSGQGGSGHGQQGQQGNRPGQGQPGQQRQRNRKRGR